MDRHDLCVEVRDPLLQKVGRIDLDDLDLLAQVHLNDVGSWTLKLPESHPMVSYLKTPGYGILITTPWNIDGTGNPVLMSGPVIKFSRSASAFNPISTYTFTGATDDIILADRLVWPNRRTEDMTKQYPTKISGKAETLLVHLAMANAGPLAVSSRRAYALNVHDTSYASYTRGKTAHVYQNFQDLLDCLAEVAYPSKMSFRVVQIGGYMFFETFAQRDKTNVIRLSTTVGTLANGSVTVSAPGSTRAIVAGGARTDRPTYRVFRQVTDATGDDSESTYGRRIEKLVNGGGESNATKLDDMGEDAISLDNFSLTSSQLQPADDAAGDMRVGKDFWVGDKISVAVDSNLRKTTVLSVIIRSAADGTHQVGLTVGDRVKPSKADTLGKLDTKANKDNGVDLGTLSSIGSDTDPETAISSGDGYDFGTSPLSDLVVHTVAAATAGSGAVALGSSGLQAVNNSGGVATLNLNPAGGAVYVNGAPIGGGSSFTSVAAETGTSITPSFTWVLGNLPATSFTAPASGAVLVSFTAGVVTPAAAHSYQCGVSVTASGGTPSNPSAAHQTIELTGFTTGAQERRHHQRSFLYTGLTAGAVYTIRDWHINTGANNATCQSFYACVTPA